MQVTTTDSSSRRREDNYKRRRRQSPSRSPDPRQHRQQHRSRSPDSKRWSASASREQRPSQSPSPSRDRDRDRDRKPRQRRRRSRSTSYDSRSSGTEEETHSEDSSEEERRRRKRRKERKVKEKEKEKKRKHKKDKKDKKKKKDKSESKLAGENFGKYGILHDTDIYTKEQEFHAWLMDVMDLSPETTPKVQMKKHFLKYMEDFNLGELPHEKYYNLEKWEAQQRDMRMGIAGPVPGNDGCVNLMNDEEQLRLRRTTSRSTQLVGGVQMSHQQLAELNRVNRERIEADRLRKMGFVPKASMGVRTESVREHRGY